MVEVAACGEGIDLHQRVWKVAERMLEAAEGGDVAAAKFIVERLCGVLDKGPGATVAVQVNQPAAIGPPTPQGGELRDYVKRMSELADELLPNSPVK